MKVYKILRRFTMEILSRLKNSFYNIFKSPCEKTFFSPGRINIIGEHTDYNGGLVFPCAITLGTYGVIKLTNTNVIRAYSLNFQDFGIIEIPLDSLDYSKNHNWANYLKGVVKLLIESGHAISTGFDIVLYGNIPNGAGLSSSASLEMLICKILKDMFKLNIDEVTMALLGKKVENDYIGVNSGIMDQFAISLGRKNSALLLDCTTLNYEYVNVNLKYISIVIMNTNKRRELSSSNYNQRRNQCECALSDLKSLFNISSLCQLSFEDFNRYKYVIRDEVNVKRASHVISENQRVKKAMEVLKENDFITLGNLLNESHISLRDDYEVTGTELDTLVSSAWAQDGVYGARMTGAGFGGCAIALVSSHKVDDFIKIVGSHYKEHIGYEASFYIAATSDGPREIK